MSGKASPAHPNLPSHSFYSESPPKKSRLQDDNYIKPLFKDFKDRLRGDLELSEPISSHGPKGPDTIATITAPTDDNNNGESKSLDRESPIPLKNLGNTCYENSIIQCLFSLGMFMDNFERSMEKLRSYVVKSNSTQDQAHDDAKNDQEKQHITSSKQSEHVISVDDVRFRIANAFDNLYKCYIQKRNQIETPASDQISSSADDEQIKRQSNQQTQLIDVESETPTVSLQPSSSDQSIARLTQSSTPIALVSSTSLPNEQLEIETRLEELKSAVGERSSQFNSAHQQDASEFFYHVIDSIQEFYQGLNRNDEDDNPVTKAFELELDYLTKCPKCHHKIISDPERIRTLPLALPHVDLDNSTTNCSGQFNQDLNRIPTPPTSDLGLDSPESSTREDLRNGLEEKENQALSDNLSSTSINNHNPNNDTDNMSTPKSSPLLDKSDQMDITPTQPKQNYTLCDALNNYFKDDILESKCSQPNCDSEKRTKKCLIRKLPQILFITLARYSYTGKKNLDEIEAPFELTVPFQENKSPSHSGHSKQFSDSDDKYQLIAVVCHLGSSLNAGHYTSYVFNQNNLCWYSCDDDSITRVNEEDVKSNASKSGYCFFYAHESCIAQKPQSQVIDQKQLQENEAAVRETYYFESSAVLTPESSPSPAPSSSSSEEDWVSPDYDMTILNSMRRPKAKPKAKGHITSMMPEDDM